MHFGPANIALHAAPLTKSLLAAQAAVAAMPPVLPASAFVGLHVTGLEALQQSIRDVASVVAIDPAVLAAEAAAVQAEEQTRVAAPQAEMARRVAAEAAAAEQARVAAVEAEMARRLAQEQVRAWARG